MRTGWRLAGALAAAAGVCLLLPGLAAAAPVAGGAGTSVLPGAWQQRALQVPTPGNNSQLSAVGCDRGNHCWAVGEHGTRSGSTFGEVFRWTGGQWAAASTPNSHRQSSLSAISCPAPHRCLAVGWTKPHGKAIRAGALRWNGTRWSVASAPAGVGSLAALSCTAPRACWALDVQDGLAVHWNGHRWGRPVRFPGTVDPTAIACAAATDCWVAGLYVRPHNDNLYNLIMHWNGRTWRGVRVPQPGNTNVLNAVTCVSKANCWAAGSHDTRASVRTRNEVLHWNGSHWSLVPTPKGPRVNSELLGISCLMKTSCWAVGDDGATTEALHWNGHHWSLVRTPDPGGAGFLFNVRCLSRADCLAVGYSHLPATQNLALHWNGTKWVSV
jgi:hypothetical protein